MKEKGIVFEHFVRTSISNSKHKVPVYTCQFCGKQYALHATRMSKHLIQGCKVCPENVKTRVKKGLKGRRRSNDSGELQSSLRGDTSTVASGVSQSSTPLTSKTTFEVIQDSDVDNSASTSTTPTSSYSRRRHNHTWASRSNLLGSFVDHTPVSEEAIIWKKLATAIFATGTPLTITENKYWVDAFKRIRPSLRLPSRYTLSNSLLNDVYKDVSESTNTVLSNAKFIGVQCDCWSNIRNESIMNFILTTPAPIFYKTFATKEEKHTGQYMSEKLSEVFEEVGAKRIIGCVTDNARNMTKAWELLQNKYSNFPISFYGCASHILNLLSGDIAKLKSVESMIGSAKSIVKTFKNKLVLSATFARIQKEKLIGKKIQSLKLPVATRWASVMTCLESLKVNKNVLQSVAITEVGHSELDKNDRCNILDDDVFWVKVEKFLSLLKPIEKWIKILQSNQSRISEVTEAFHEIKKHFAVEVPTSPLLANEEGKALKIVEERERMCLRPIHFAANILDPTFKAQNLSNSNCNQGLEYIYKLASHIDDVDVSEIFKNIAEYRSGSGFFSLEFVKISMQNKKISALDFWKGICTDFPLRKVAEAILTMPPTSAATERSFSAQGFIHTKKRNRLTTSRAGMLTYIHHNLNLSAEKKIKTTEQIEENEVQIIEEESAEVTETGSKDQVEETTDFDEEESEEEEDLYKEMEECLQADSEVSNDDDEGGKRNLDYE